MGHHSTDGPAGAGHVVEAADAVRMGKIDILLIQHQFRQLRQSISVQRAAHILRHICIFHGFQKNIDQISLLFGKGDFCLQRVYIFLLIDGGLLADIIEIAGQVYRHRCTEKHHAGKHQRNDPRPFFRKGIDFLTIPPSEPEKESQHHKSRQCGQERRQHKIADHSRVRTAHFRKERIQNGVKPRIPEFRDVPAGREKSQTSQKQQDDADHEDDDILFMIIFFVHIFYPLSDTPCHGLLQIHGSFPLSG